MDNSVDVIKSLILRESFYSHENQQQVPKCFFGQIFFVFLTLLFY